MTHPSAPSPERDKGTARIEAFSDGVLAIIITLLVFGIQVPSRETVAQDGLLRALLDQWPMYLAFTASFFFILVMWINHHRLFLAIRRSDNTLMLLNGLLLFGISLVPFPTAVVAEYLDHPEQTVAVMVYNGWYFVIAIFFNLLWRYAGHHNRLFDAQTDPALVAFITRQYSVGPLLYLGAALLAFVHPLVSLLASIALAVFFALPNRDVDRLIGQ
ncbi:MAG TPA: TMEM175 family protein [Aggregatilinea sp.]|jgi:uncharacterized membrane protein|uniref:TMEM175 family protein n=1 Tax=Aggregatilinea sp. TaxID=2806333 RepID=UPI002B91C778|nr:TMEM175 family protein [Aggregatilinea sp.]HML23824.1 TMEM175 family protein [Aggregatilinea sp.]